MKLNVKALINHEKEKPQICLIENLLPANSNFDIGTKELVQDFHRNQSGFDVLDRRSQQNWFRNSRSHADRWSYVSMPRGKAGFGNEFSLPYRMIFIMI